MSQSFKISLQLTKKIDDFPVFYKIDGERFKENNTLKLHVDSTYRVVLECRPAMDIRSVNICGIKVDGTLNKKDTGISSYEGTWSSDMIPKTQRKVRSFLPVCVAFEDGATVETSLQSKLYSLKDKTHVTWGTRLNCIELNCCRRQEGSLIFVNEVIFR